MSACVYLTKLYRRRITTCAIDEPLKVGIVGGSLGGLFSAVALQSLGFHVDIFERSCAQKRSGAGYSLTPPLLDYLKYFHIINNKNFDSILLKSVHTDIIDENDEIETKNHESQPRLQTTWDCLYYETLKKLHSKQIHFNKNMIDINHNDINNNNKMRINFDDNTYHSCDIIIGCDGLGSKIRWNIPDNINTKMNYPGYSLWRGIVKSSQICKSSKLYQMRDKNKAITFLGKNTQFICFIVPDYNKTNDDHVLYNWAWYLYYDYEKDLKNRILIDKYGITHSNSLQKGYIRNQVHSELKETAMSDIIPKSLAELVLLTEYPMFQVVYDYKCKSMIKVFDDNMSDNDKGIILVGDSAFIARPHTTRGVSKASGDVLCLYDKLKQYRLGNISFNDALMEYNDERMIIGNEAVEQGIGLGQKIMSDNIEKQGWAGTYIRTPTGNHTFANSKF